MNDVMAKGLEGALLAAVDSDETGASVGSGGAGTTSDLVSLAFKVLPKLLANSDDRDALVELQKEGVSVLRKEVRLLRRQLHEMVQSHNGILEELHLLRELQSTMVAHLARVQILEASDDEELSDEFDEYPEEYGYGEDLVARPRRRGEVSPGSKTLRKNGRRNPHLGSQ